MICQHFQGILVKKCLYKLHVTDRINNPTTTNHFHVIKIVIMGRGTRPDISNYKIHRTIIFESHSHANRESLRFTKKDPKLLSYNWRVHGSSWLLEKTGGCNLSCSKTSTDAISLRFKKVR